jgi:hypothetical protein
MFWAPTNNNGCHFGHHCCLRMSPDLIKHKVDTNIYGPIYIYFYVTFLILARPFYSGLGKYMRKAARPSGGMDSSNPRRWRGKQLHHYDCGVCWLFVLLWIDL